MKETLLIIPSVSHTTKFLKHRYNLISDYEVFNGEVNFDKVLLFDDSCDFIEDICKIKNIPIIGCKRYSKSLQYEILKSLEVKTPKTYYTTENYVDYNNFYTICKDIPSDVPIIVKDQFGARSMGLCKMSSKDVFYKLLYVLDDKDDRVELVDSLKGNKSTKTDILFDELIPEVTDYYDDVKEHLTFYGRVHSESEREYVSNFLGSGNFIVQELENVKAEYRMMWFYDDCILKRRDKESVGEKYDTEYKITDEQEVYMEAISEKLANYLNTPFLSIDFYITTDNKVGVFEFQMQMGFTTVDKTSIVNKTIESVISKFKDIGQ